MGIELTYLCAPEDLQHFHRPALVLGHPGHELKVFGWALAHKPRVYVLTDGSVRGEVPRVPTTAKLLDGLGATRGELFGVLSDSDFYTAVREQRVEVFLDIAERLADSFVENGIDLVAADAIEGYHPAHDLCRILVEAAVETAHQRSGKTIADYDFRLTEGADQAQHGPHCLHLQLNDELLERKLTAASEYSEMGEEVNLAIGRHGTEYFRVECLRKVVEPFPGWPDSHKPEYEIRGERQVARGNYESPIRYREHVVPLIKAIRRHASSGAVSAIK